MSTIAKVSVIWHIYNQCHKFPSIGLLRRLLVDIPIALSTDIMYNYFTKLPNNHPLTFKYLPCDLRSSDRIHGRGRSETLRLLFYLEALWSIYLRHSRMNSLGFGRLDATSSTRITVAPQRSGALWGSWTLSIVTLSQKILVHANSLTHDINYHHYCAIWVPQKYLFEVLLQSHRFSFPPKSTRSGLSIKK